MCASAISNVQSCTSTMLHVCYGEPSPPPPSQKQKKIKLTGFPSGPCRPGLHLFQGHLVFRSFQALPGYLWVPTEGGGVGSHTCKHPTDMVICTPLCWTNTHLSSLNTTISLQTNSSSKPWISWMSNRTRKSNPTLCAF